MTGRPPLLAKLSGEELHKPAPQVSQQHHIWVKASAKFMQISAHTHTQVFFPQGLASDRLVLVKT
jgi:hypothetical protein